MQGGEVSLIELFLQAGPVVKFVILSLIAASIWCWVIIFESLWSLTRLGRAIRRRGKAGGRVALAVAHLFAAGRSEAATTIEGEDSGSRRQRVASLMKRRAQEIVEQGQGGLANLAVIASVAPFVGLFGTVWGFMASFTGIAAAKDTSLAVVAPGIAEALAATAIGLATAIPAAFAYNRLVAAFNKHSRALSRMVDDEAGEILRQTAGEGQSRARLA